MTKAFAEFVSLKKVNIKVYQTLSDVQTLHVDFEACYTKTTLAVDEAAYYSYSQTELLLNEGDVIGYSFNGNIRDKKKPQAQFCYYSSKGFQTTCLIDVHNPYGQRSLPAFHGVIQLYSMSEARVWPVDVMTSPDFDEAWECIIEIPVTLPKVIAKVTSTVSKAPLALELEGSYIRRRFPHHGNVSVLIKFLQKTNVFYLNYHKFSIKSYVLDVY